MFINNISGEGNRGSGVISIFEWKICGIIGFSTISFSISTFITTFVL